MHADGGDIGGVADDREHLLQTLGTATSNEFVQQGFTNATPDRVRRDIDRVLDRVSIRGPGAEVVGVGVANDAAALDAPPG